MSAGQYVTSVVLSIVATAGTYLAMHHLVPPPGPPAQQAVEVPQVVGLTADQARGLVEPLGLLLVLDGEKEPDSDRIAAGNLFEQRPIKGSRILRGGELHAYVATAPQLVPIPNLAGQPVDAAKRLIQQAGLRVGNVTEAASPTVAVGMIIATVPAFGEKLRRNEAVELQVSKGGEQVPVPNVRGRSAGSARAALEQVGLLLGEVRHGSDDNAADGAVLRQNPPAGTSVPKGQKVDIVVND
jgi:serine/threonine-protein kinase